MYLDSQLYGIESFDPMTFVIAPASRLVGSVTSWPYGEFPTSEASLTSREAASPTSREAPSPTNRGSGEPYPSSASRRVTKPSS